MSKAILLIIALSMLVTGCSGGTQPAEPAAAPAVSQPAAVAPAAAPVAAPAAAQADMRQYKCSVCGYIYDPAANNNVPFSDLPADWKCPRCHNGKDKFSPVG